MDQMEMSEQIVASTASLEGVLVIVARPHIPGSFTAHDCPLFPTFGLRRPGGDVKYTLRLRAVRHAQEDEVESSKDSTQTMLLDSLLPSEAILFDSSCSVEAVIKDAAMEIADMTSQEDELMEIAELPTRHILLREGQMAKPLVRRAVKRHVVTLGLSWTDAVHHLPALLADLTPSCPLRHIHIFPVSKGKVVPEIREEDIDLLVHALMKSTSSSRVHGIDFTCPDFSHEAQQQVVWNSLLETLNSMAYFGLWHPSSWRLDTKAAAARIHPSSLRLKHLSLGVNVFYNLHLPFIESGSVITCLDLRDGALSDTLDKDRLRALLTAVSSGMRQLTDLGLRIEDQTCLHIMRDTKVHSRILVLRLYSTKTDDEFLERAWKLLILDKDSTVQFFDGIFDLKAGFLHWLAGTNPPAALTALKIDILPGGGFTNDTSEILQELANFLCSPAASNLSYVEFHLPDPLGPHVGRNRDLDWVIANSLINNFTLCTFVFGFADALAESYAFQLLRRNRLYRDSQLLKETQVKPDVAKLFLCGHATVGKTTLRMALQSRENLLPTLSLTQVPCLKIEPDRTLGLQTHHLSFRNLREKLLICDLGGHEEYHVFHHYFMNASINDIFIVVCKYDKSCLSEKEFHLQLEYWLRFIVSHRSTRKKRMMDSNAKYTDNKPNVIVVVNHFQQTKFAAAITSEWTSDLMQKFSEVVEFGQHNQYKNLFGLNAKKGFGVTELYKRLKDLLSDFHKAAMPIPQLCSEISAHLTLGPSKSWRGAHMLAKEKARPRLLTSYSEVLEAVSRSESKHADIESLRVQAALQELHTQGNIIIFPSEGTNKAHGSSNNTERKLVGKDSTNNILVIIDTNWFSNKLVGSLLGTHLEGAPRRSCPWKWSKVEIKNMLRNQGCLEQHLEEILRYLERLELCVSLDSNSDAEGQLLFPALVKEEKIIFPHASKASAKFYGRRLKCMDTSIHLIPFAIFTRLQVKLHKAYSADNGSVHHGYGWVSFMSGMVGVVVRFGGDLINEVWECKQWIDILVFCPEDHGRNTPRTSANLDSRHMDDERLAAAQKVMGEIRSNFFATCKEGDLGGIPTVPIEEMVLQNETAKSDSQRLSSILDKARTGGLLTRYQEWETGASTRLIDLLLLDEIEGVVKGQLDVLESIKEEYSLGAEDDGSEAVQMKQDVDKGQSDVISEPSQLCGEFQILESSLNSAIKSSYKDVKSQIESSHKDLKSHMKKIDQNLQMIRTDIWKLGAVLQQSAQDIIANCSTRLLRNELRKDSRYPLYPYLVGVEGKLAALEEALFVKRVVRVHFLCESPAEGPHLVEGQKGKEVNIDWKPWVRKAARVLVPALRVICCAARLAAALYLPSAQVFIPTPEALVSGLGLEREALQHVILARAVEALVKGLPDVDLDQLMRCRPEAEETQEVIAAILANKEVDMWADFGLKRVIVEDDEKSGCHRSLWVCNRHAGGKAELLRTNANPFRSS